MMAFDQKDCWQRVSGSYASKGRFHWRGSFLEMLKFTFLKKQASSVGAILVERIPIVFFIGHRDIPLLPENFTVVSVCIFIHETNIL